MIQPPARICKGVIGVGAEGPAASPAAPPQLELQGINNSVEQVDDRTSFYSSIEALLQMGALDLLSAISGLTMSS